VLILLPRNPERLQWLCQIRKKFQSMNWTHLNWSSEEERRSQRHVCLFLRILSAYCSSYSVLNVFVLWVLVIQWLPLWFYFHIEAQAKGCFFFRIFRSIYSQYICSACATLCLLYLFVQVYISLKICRQLWQSYLPYNLQGTYLAKWYGSKVFVKILDKDSFSDADSM